MSRVPAAGFASMATAFLTLSLLAACQTTAPPPAAPTPVAFADPPSRDIRTGKGWAVTLHKPDGGRPYCRATKPANGGPQLTFRTGPAEASVTLAETGTPVRAGEAYQLIATFDTGSRETLKAVGQPDGSLKITVPTLTYLEDLESFSRAKRVTFRCPELGGVVGTMPLTGTSWAINASDECRILNAEG